MKDPRIEKLADTLINFSTNVQSGEKVLIEVFGEAALLAAELVKKTYQAGGVPFLNLMNHTLLREILKEATVEQMRAMAGWDRARMAEMQVYIGLRAGDNGREGSSYQVVCIALSQSVPGSTGQYEH
jgi:aminopeptidase